MKPTRARLLELFTYDAEKGELYWNARPVEDFNSPQAAARRNGKMAGRRAGSTTNEGYIGIRIDGKTIRAHQIIWFLENGVWPVEIDHEDGDKANNRIGNLRDVSHAENMKNIVKRRDNRSGVPGVMWEKSKGLWVARIAIDGKLTTLGRSKDINKVIALRKAAEVENGYHRNHGRAA